MFLGNAQVGIETNTPKATLHVYKTGDASLTSTSHGLTIGNHEGTNLAMDDNEIIARNNGSFTLLGLNGDGGDVAIRNNASMVQRVMFKDNGRVGIGTTTPRGQLELLNASGKSSSTFNAGYLEISRNEDTGPMYGGYIDLKKTYDDDFRVRLTHMDDLGETQSQNGFALRISTDGSPGTATNKVVVLDTGEVGIGTNAPQGALHINTVIDAGDNTPGDGASLIIGDYTGLHIQQDNNEITFMSNASTEKGRIVGGNYLGIVHPELVDIDTPTVKIRRLGAGTVVSDASGNLSVSSDVRLKNVTGEFHRGLNALQNIQPIQYRWKEKSGMETKGVYTGFSAQNVQANIPEAVKENSKGYLTLDDRPIMATLVNAIQELTTQLEKQSKEIKALKEELETLKKQ